MCTLAEGLWCLNLAIAAVRASVGGVQGPGASANEHLRAFCLSQEDAHGAPWKLPQQQWLKENPDRLTDFRLLTAGEAVSVSLSEQEVEQSPDDTRIAFSLDVYLFISPTPFYLSSSLLLFAVIARHASLNYSALFKPETL